MKVQTKVRLVSAGTSQTVEGTWYGVAIVAAHDPESIRRVAWGPSLRGAIDAALGICALEGWSVPPGARWWGDR